MDVSISAKQMELTDSLKNYVEERIQTVFLNGRAVDNLNKAIITEDSTLALSAAMPGIAGATMRRSGRYSAMRGQISHENNAQRSGSRTGKLTLKLFNLIAKELGPDFLCKGIWLKGSYFKDFILTQSNSFWEDCGECRLNERPSDKASLLSTEWDESDFFLKLQVKK